MVKLYKIGTIDEAAQVLTLMDTHRIEDIPVILFGKEYWKPFTSWLEHLTHHYKLINPRVLTLFKVVDTTDEALNIIIKGCKKGIRELKDL